MSKLNFFSKSVTINCSVSKAFKFHSDTNNLTKITPDYIKVKLIKIDLPLRLGSEIELEITQFGILKNTWSMKLTSFDENSIITDTQVKGPFRKWVHDHIFEDLNGKVKMTDRINYELPFGVLGNFADNLFVRKMINRQFEFRHKVTKNILESGSID